MLKVNSIKNVNYTLKNISFKGGLQTNYGIEAPAPEKNMVEGGLLTGFFGTIAPLFSKNVNSRAESIQDGLEKTKLDIQA